MSGYGKGWHKIKNWNFKTIILGLAIRRMSNNGKIFLPAVIVTGKYKNVLERWIF